MNETHKPFDNPKIRQAVALRDQPPEPGRHVLRRHTARRRQQLDAADDLVSKDENLPTYDLEKAKAAHRRVRRDATSTFDFWYPSDVIRPYMPDPKGIFQAIQPDLEAVGFKIEPEHQAVEHRTTSTTSTPGKYPMWLIGWTCDWAGPDNFLDTAFFGTTATGKPNPEFAYKNDELNTP